ncbi:hypothetical protein GWK47_008411 [Chionoecetes opilio]|uniref:CRIB domain-containing protein n=1 Tax=Chionoecetes opilio TaxID=41210 RepID=A0A8J4Y8T8_CHIOP|nr:hypothetical protein GWK47_008411 [Chionoecetes opilio]
MISFPTNFRHVLHIDPTTADPERLSLLLKTSGVLEQETEYEEEEEEEEEWPPEDPPLGEVPEEAPRGTEGPLKAPKAHRPSSRVRKSMISFPTNFQHVDHISAGERIYAPDSPPPQIPPDFPPPQIPPEPDPGAEDGEKLSSWSGSQSEADVCNSRSDETDFDSSLAQFRIPPPPPSPHQNGKAMIGPPTNFQHVSHVGFGGLGSED